MIITKQKMINISIAELNGADEHGIEVSQEVYKDSDGDNIEISADNDRIEKIAIIMVQIVMRTMSIAFEIMTTE